MADVTPAPEVPGPVLTGTRLPREPRGLVLVLHGGAERGLQPVDGSSLSWRRGRMLLRDVARPLRRDGIGAVLLRYRVKGWNETPGHLPAPVADARWALDEIGRAHGLPVVLLGHSMGARTAAAVADHPSVRGVVALAPWFPVAEPVAPLQGKVLRAAHGRTDRVTSARATRAYVERAGRVCDASFTDMGDTGHYLLRGMRAWNAFAADRVREVLAGRAPDD